ncbi:MAG: T9SS type A sorting domain-containing protein [Bacteroidota bacterium]
MSINTSNYRPGIYTYTVTADGQKTTRKMIVQ